MKKIFLISGYKILKKFLFFSILCLGILANNIENERKYLELEKRQHELKKEKFNDEKKPLETQKEDNEEPLFYIKEIELTDKYKIFNKEEEIPDQTETVKSTDKTGKKKIKRRLVSEL